MCTWTNFVITLRIWPFILCQFRSYIVIKTCVNCKPHGASMCRTQQTWNTIFFPNWIYIQTSTENKKFAIVYVCTYMVLVCEEFKKKHVWLHRVVNRDVKDFENDSVQKLHFAENFKSIRFCHCRFDFFHIFTPSIAYLPILPSKFSNSVFFFHYSEKIHDSAVVIHMTTSKYV